MKLFVIALVAVPFFALAPLFSQEPAPAPAPKAKTDEKAKVPVYDEAAIGKDQIATALARARRDNTRVLIHWGANWCGWCKLLAELEKSDKDISKELLYEYTVVKIDIGKWNKNMDLAKKYGVDLTKTGVPFLTVLDADGKLLENKETGSLELPDKEKQAHDPAKVLAFLKSHEAPRLEAQPVYDAALATAKKDGKRVFLHFGAPWCGWCHRLEDWMAKPEIAAVLGKEFVDLKIDTDRMPGGKEMLARLTDGKEGGIPWFVFLDADGKVLVDSNATGGNIGFPAKPEEIAHFRGMLEKACVKISKDEIAMLADSLVPPKKPAETPRSGDKPTGTDQ